MKTSLKSLDIHNLRTSRSALSPPWISLIRPLLRLQNRTSGTSFGVPIFARSPPVVDLSVDHRAAGGNMNAPDPFIIIRSWPSLKMFCCSSERHYFSICFWTHFISSCASCTRTYAPFKYIKPPTNPPTIRSTT
jgi:hypothetical protein